MFAFWRSWLTVCVLVATVVAILAGLVTLQYESTLSHLIQGRLRVLTQTSHASFNAALSLGLPLSTVRNARAILERARQSDPEIISVHVFDTQGRILHSTDADHGTSVRAEVLFAATASEDTFWYTETDVHLLSGALFADPASGLTGGLVIVYPRSELATPVRAMMTRLATRGAAVVLAVGLLAGVVLRFGLRELVRVHDGIEVAFAALERDAWRRPAGSSDPFPGPVRGLGIDTGELMDMLQEADARYIAAGRALAALEESDGLDTVIGREIR